MSRLIAATAMFGLALQPAAAACPEGDTIVVCTQTGTERLPDPTRRRDTAAAGCHAVLDGKRRLVVRKILSS